LPGNGAIDMATGRLSGVIRHLRRATLLPDGGGMTDGQLLECFIIQRDEAAFEALVRRHGPMVLAVCRRVLGNIHDAEDAFQATFLVLVRKATAIGQRELLGNWLYGAAYRAALETKAARRRVRERQVSAMPESQAVVEAEVWLDLRPVLDQELSRLPDKYRVGIVLCDLEGKTRREAALQLGLPEGTLAGRLMRGRAMLAKRLARHGLVLSGGALAAALSQGAASAAVPTLAVSSTIKAATLFAAGQAAAGLVSAKVAALTEGVLKAMLLTKLKRGTAVLLVLTLVTLTGSVVARGQTGNQSESVDKPKQAAERKEGDASARTPPDLKEGVRILFADSRTKWKFTKDEQSALVVRVQGNWVFLKYVEPQGLSLDGLTGCWINFNNIEWYLILPSRPN
jgi:RNA polymerase sigma factor (sigma-70 family)